MNTINSETNQAPRRRVRQSIECFQCHGEGRVETETPPFIVTCWVCYGTGRLTSHENKALDL